MENKVQSQEFCASRWFIYILYYKFSELCVRIGSVYGKTVMVVLQLDKFYDLQNMYRQWVLRITQNI